MAYMRIQAQTTENSCKDDLLIVSLSLIKSPTQSLILSFAKTEYLDLDKKIEGLAYMPCPTVIELGPAERANILKSYVL